MTSSPCTATRCSPPALIARLCDEFGLDLPLAVVFEEPTLAGLGAAVDALRWAEADNATDGIAPGDDREVIRL